MKDDKSKYFDSVNQERHDKNTVAIHQALQRIRDDYTLKPTVKFLSELSGMHRNSLRNRKWPIEQLDKIKSERNKNIVLEVTKDRSKVASLEDVLDNAKNELTYWFNLAKDLEKQNAQLFIKLDRISSSREYYEAEYNKSKIIIKDLQLKIKLLEEN
ncbi:hypothetical protein [Shewanella decolorationis]|uniref:Uncharacterized protein n=1 Tax=Shewanella decolorationis S12 TaxID=1353536 RepID=A0ABN0PNQ7_9GAMM|nr:hypothetical protein [Shewanella decolorationis]ESE41670.1 hypothetical protein SHD_1745 [Shewanella decolorationis S12]GLR33736.1 hypothetical protein GCM10007922_32950 [Shewanella decolorationis]